MTASEAWDRLSEAMDTTRPACADRPEFTADNLTAEQRQWCASVCATCKLFEPCASYATAARVRVGFWAGKLRGTSR